MPSTFFGLNIASSGMSTYQTKLNTTAHNIANIGTTGYSKQVVNQSASQAISLGTTYGMIGSGTTATSITNLRNTYYDAKYRSSNSSCAKYTTELYYMQDIEDYFYSADSDTASITNALDDFFTSLTSLTTSVADTTIRQEVVSSADTLLAYIQEAATSLQTMQQDINEQIADTVDQINAYAQEIAALTRQINTIEVYGTTANDLRDQRATLVDELSELVDVDVVEKTSADGTGLSQYVVSINGAVLVDTYEYNTLICEASDTYYAINDIEGLYNITWSTGQDFGIHNSMGGTLEALFSLRDGNNGEVFQGTANGTAGSTELVVTDVNEQGSSILTLDIPTTDGVITINNSEYAYESFDVTVDEDGNYTYTFHLKSELGMDFTDATARIGDEVDFRGIPYYMSQLNEFVRTFSYYFNQVQESGYDLNGNQGKQMFLATDKATGATMKFDDSLTDFSFSSLLETDEDGRVVTTDGYASSTYYNMTALNVTINSEILGDGSLLACSDSTEGYAENGENLSKMIDLESDTKMFSQGEPASFLQVMISTIAVDTEKATNMEENAENIRDAIEQRRLSTSGVDEDEEGQDLIIYQNLLEYQYQVLSIMNEVLDKLINDTAV